MNPLQPTRHIVQSSHRVDSGMFPRLPVSGALARRWLLPPSKKFSSKGPVGRKNSSGKENRKKIIDRIFKPPDL